MINILQEISEKPKSGENAHQFFLRFNDLPPDKQNHLIKVIMENSSIWTIRAQRKISKNQIQQILESTNPIIWKINKEYITKPFYHWKEKGLSQLIYHYWRVAFNNKRPNRNLRWITEWLVWDV